MSSGERIHVSYSFVKIKIVKATQDTSWYADKVGQILEVRKKTYTDDYGIETGHSYEVPGRSGFDPSYGFNNYDVKEITKQDIALAKATGTKL